MHFFVQINNCTFPVGSSLAHWIQYHNLKCILKIQEKNRILKFEQSCLYNFQIVSSTSLTHFYVQVLDRKFRVNKNLYLFLKKILKNGNNHHRNSLAKQLGQYYSAKADYILQGLSLPNKVNIIEPFIGYGDLVKWVSKFNPKKVTCFDIQPQESWIKKQDTLTTPPNYSKSYVVTNPPFLSKAKAKSKDIFIAYKTNDLYKCFIISLIKSNCSGGVIILPANFWFSNEVSTRKVRQEFLAKYAIRRINIFEEQVFNDVRITTCAFSFSLRKNMNEVTEIIIFPKNEQFLINISNDEIAKLSPYFGEADYVKVTNSSTVKAKGMNYTSLELLSVDSSKGRKIGVYLRKGNNEQNSLRIRISTNIYLNFEEQVEIMNEFNLIIEEYRKKYSSLLFTYFLSCHYQGFDRKRISTKTAFNIISHLIRNKKLRNGWCIIEKKWL